MDREKFKKMFLLKAEEALSLGREKAGGKLPATFKVEMHGAGVSGGLMTADEAVNLMYLGDETFYRIIDIGFKGVNNENCILFVRISGHPPAEFGKTWNIPAGSGPFKVLLPMGL